MTNHTIRPGCLRPAQDGWELPTGEEVREVLKLCGFTGLTAAEFLGLRTSGSRTVRRWTSSQVGIPYPAWALLCVKAGLGNIWE